MPIRQVTSDDEARSLAKLLNGDERKRPIVVVTTPTQSNTPYIDADLIASDLGDLAEVYLIATGPHTWTFSDQMAPFTQVYGGAGRVYPMGREWIDDPYRSPLRFAYDKAEGSRATQLLIDDGLDMAAGAGLIGQQSGKQQRQSVEGVVRGIVSERALVGIAAGMVTVPPQLAAPGVPIERVLAEGMPVTGRIEPDSRWLDVREMALSADQALASYRVGDVVLAQVATVGAGSAELRLHPDQIVTVDRRDVTGELAGDLRSLLTDDEVLAVRIVATGPAWQITLYDADDEPRPAVALFAGGPPWLVVPDEDEPEHDTEALTAPVRGVTKAPPDEPEREPEPEMGLHPAAVPSPLLLDPRRRHAAPRTAPPAAAASRAVTAPPRPGAIDGLKDRIRVLESQLHGLEQENAQLLEFRRTHEARLQQQSRQLADLRKQLRNAKGQSASNAMPEFADRERGFRHAVEHAWATRIPIGEQPTRPLSDYAIGRSFLDSLDALEGVSTAKVADVVFEVVIGLAESLGSRDMHRLRTGPGGDDSVQAREDGAVCWRVAIQQSTPSARRLHFWRLKDGTVELSRVVLHDDMEP